MNPARELALLLEAWRFRDRGASIYAARGSETGMTQALVDGFAKGFRLIGELDRILDSLESSGRTVDHYRRSRPAWAAGLVVPDEVWATGTNHRTEFVAQAPIDQLLALADVIDGEASRFQLDGASVAATMEAVGELFDLLSEDTIPLGVAEKRYVVELMSHVRRLLEEERSLDRVDLARSVNELRGFLTTLADELEDRGEPTVADRIRETSRRIRPWVVNSSIAVAGAIGVAANLKALTGP